MRSELASPAAWLPRTPFWSLVAHFVKRLFASEEEQGEEGMSLGLGVGLALLASPGAFASIFLLDKYSTLLQWIRGQRHFDFYQASAADEYFFVVLSMTITGLVMVMRWNRLFPDRRDFANLAALPLPIHQVFLANFVALLGLAVLFAVDVNAVSSFLFPGFVTVSDGRWGAFSNIALGHLAAVFSGSLFSFFAVFALVGVLTLLVPGRWLRAVSVGMRILLAVGLLLEFFSNLFLQLFTGRLPAHPDAFFRWLPSFWFLGVYEASIGIAKPAMLELSHWAVSALGLAIGLAVGSYALCYQRHFLRLAETFDTLTGSRHGAWFKLPDRCKERFFHSPFEEACILFAFRVMTRSERHVMFLGGYLGIGLVLVAENAAQDPPAIPLLLAFFLISGLRLAFDLPAALSANWAFQFSANDVTPGAHAVARRLMRMLVLPFQFLPLGGMAAIPLNIGFSLLAIDLIFRTFQRIPFTYRVQPDSRKMVMRFVLGLLSLLLVAPFLAQVERWAMASGWRYGIVALTMGAAWLQLRRGRRELERESVSYEDRSTAELELLKLAPG